MASDLILSVSRDPPFPLQSDNRNQPEKREPERGPQSCPIYLILSHRAENAICNNPLSPLTSYPIFNFLKRLLLVTIAAHSQLGWRSQDQVDRDICLIGISTLDFKSRERMHSPFLSMKKWRFRRRVWRVRGGGRSCWSLAGGRTMRCELSILSLGLGAGPGYKLVSFMCFMALA